MEVNEHQRSKEMRHSHDTIEDETLSEQGYKFFMLNSAEHEIQITHIK